MFLLLYSTLVFERDKMEPDKHAESLEETGEGASHRLAKGAMAWDAGNTGSNGVKGAAVGPRARRATSTRPLYNPEVCSPAPLPAARYRSISSAWICGCPGLSPGARREGASAVVFPASREPLINRKKLTSVSHLQIHNCQRAACTPGRVLRGGNPTLKEGQGPPQGNVKN